MVFGPPLQKFEMLTSYGGMLSCGCVVLEKVIFCSEHAMCIVPSEFSRLHFSTEPPLRESLSTVPEHGVCALQILER